MGGSRSTRRKPNRHSADMVGLLLSGRAPGADEIHPEYLKAMVVVGLSWLTHLCSIKWQSGTVPLDWQTRMVVPLLKKGDQRVCSNYPGITLLSLPGKVYSGVPERRIRTMVEPPIQEEHCSFCPGRGSGSLGVCPSSPHVLCGLVQGVQPCPSWHSVGGASGVWGQRPSAGGSKVPVRPEQELSNQST